MKKPVYVCALLVAAFFLLSTPASADVLYNNGLVNGGYNNYEMISVGAWVSDSFTLAGTSTLTGVNLVISIASGFIPYDLSWRISDTHWDTYPFTNDHGTEASLTNLIKLCTGSVSDPTVCKTINNSPGDTYSASFSLPNVVKGPGTYFLTLDWGYGNHGSLYWDVNNGPSQAWIDGYSVKTLYGDDGKTHSNSFQILGTTDTSAVPEPSCLLLLGTLLAGLGGFIRLKHLV
jgi:hypothetical protein